MPRGKWRGLGRGLSAAGQGLMGIAGLMADMEAKGERSANRMEENYESFQRDMELTAKQGATESSYGADLDEAISMGSISTDHKTA